MAGIAPPAHRRDEGRQRQSPIYFDSIDNSAYILGKSPHSARKSWIYVNGESLNAIRVDLGGDSQEPWLNIAWKLVWTAKDSWLGPTQGLGSIPAVYSLSYRIRLRDTT